MQLYNYFRSSASFRVRIALHLKGLAYDYLPVHIGRGEHLQPAYAVRSAERLVPLLDTGDALLSQSLAIIEYLDETHPQPPLLPSDALGRARVRALAQTVACDTHPVTNLRVLKYLAATGTDDAGRNAWYRHWCRTGLDAFERQLAALQRPASGFCFGNTPGLADCCLVPQIFNARRFAVPLDGLPHTMAAFDACMALEAFARAQPSACPDNEP